MGQLNNFLSNIERLLMIGAAICLVAIMIVMVSDVVMRYLFSSPISWAFEVLTRYLMLGSFFFGDYILRTPILTLGRFGVRLSPVIAKGRGIWIEKKFYQGTASQ